MFFFVIEILKGSWGGSFIRDFLRGNGKQKREIKGRQYWYYLIENWLWGMKSPKLKTQNLFYIWNR